MRKHSLGRAGRALGGYVGDAFAAVRAVMATMVLRRSRPTWAVLLSEDRLLLAQLAPGGRLVRCSAVETASDVREETTALARHLAEVRGVLPRYRLTSKYVRLPTLDPGEATAMLDYEAPDLVPYESADIVYDHYLVPDDENGYMGAHVLLGQREPTMGAILRAAHAGLSPDRVMPSSSAFVNWFLHYRGDQFTEPEVLVVACAEFLEVLVVARDRVVFSRSVPLGRASSNVEDEAADELARSLHLYANSELFETIRSVSVLCDVPMMRGKLTDAARACKAHVSWVGEDTGKDPFLGYLFQNGEARPLPERVLLLGALLPFTQNPAVSLNLLPRHLLEERRRRRARFRLAANTAVLAVNLLLVGLLCSSAADLEESRLRGLEDRQRELEPGAAEVSRKRGQLSLMKQALQTQKSSLMLLGELHRITPTEIAISRLRFAEGGNVRLEGHTNELSHVFAFMSILRESPKFDSINYIRGGAATLSGREYATFVLELHCR